MSKKGKELYQEYLKSDTWGIIRLQRLAVDNNECVLCSERAEHVHHRRYPKKWGIETVDEIHNLFNLNDCISKIINSQTGHYDLWFSEVFNERKEIERRLDKLEKQNG